MISRGLIAAVFPVLVPWIVLSLTLVPLWIACVVLDLDAPIDLEQAAGVTRAGAVSFCVWFLIQPTGAAILSLRLFPASEKWRKLLSFVALVIICTLGSFLLGAIAEAFMGEWPARAALHWFG